MHTPARMFREKVSQGVPAIGTFLLDLLAPAAVQSLIDARFDFLLIDCEHGNQNPREMEFVLELALLRRACVFVRTPSEDRAMITRALDGGAAGVLVPAVDSMDQVRRIVRATKYRPVGRRGVHLLRAHTQHAPVDAQEFIEQANRDVLTLVQIELEPAVKIVDEIAATEGVDGLYLGPGDLSVDLGIPGQWQSPLLWNAIRAMVAACRRHGKIAACHFNHPDEAGPLLEAGVQVLGYNCDVAIFREASAGVVRTFRETVSRHAGGRPQGPS